ncbi:uncharacterized protein LOC142983795 [Anticarsia gemmatalis]|uniref:uncharacterized protein LOC142983795 n=1 Tax=Anticarsia gemmatalis TaxID=129554 RepID=UPI003F771016
MRIMQFPNLIRSKSERYELKDCDVVIDGQNYFYNTYKEQGLGYEFGAESDLYAARLRKLLTMFTQANVTCYVVFKGGDTDINKKIKKFKPNTFHPELNSYHDPVMTTDICKQVLEEAKVDFATCVFESKDDCIALAHKLKCPVISNDVEYCFSSVPYINYYNLKETTSKKYITCNIYKIQHFLDAYKLNVQKFAIFAALSDTKFFPEKHFDSLFEMWNLKDPNLYIRNEQLLHWLADHEEDEVLKNVADFLNVDDNTRFVDQVRKVLEIQTVRGGYVADYLLDKRKWRTLNNDVSWFVKGVATQKIVVPYINLYQHKVLRGSNAIEDTCPPDSIMVSIDIIKYAYNLLTNFKTNAIAVYQDTENHITVDTDLKIKRPKYDNCLESVFDNGWETLGRYQLFENFLRANNIDLHVVKQLPVDSRMLFIALAYFARKKDNVDVTKEIYCFIICHVMLQFAFEKETSARKKESGITEPDSFEAKILYRELMRREANLSEIYDGAILKTLVEMQYCLLHMNYLNTLCGGPYRTTKYHRTFNGTIVYKLLRSISSIDNNLVIQTVFENAPTIVEFINSLITVYEQLLL